MIASITNAFLSFMVLVATLLTLPTFFASLIFPLIALTRSLGWYRDIAGIFRVVAWCPILIQVGAFANTLRDPTGSSVLHVASGFTSLLLSVSAVFLAWSETDSVAKRRSLIESGVLAGLAIAWAEVVPVVIHWVHR